MNTLIACRTTIENPYVSQLVTGLSEHTDVRQATQSLSEFWRGPSEFDILHLQWPEALFRWEKPSEWELGYLKDKLGEWSATAKIVCTVHNLHPHGQKTPLYEQFYNLVYEHCHGIIHLGEASIEAVTANYGLPNKKHVVIPHGNYNCFPNEISKGEARRRLGVRSDDLVYLSFGAIRSHEEAELILNGFNGLTYRSKRLFIAGRMPWPEKRNRQWLMLKWNLARPRIRLFEGWIPNHEVQLYLNASDIVIIPRIDALNSGNVALAFTFGKVVVGPDIGVIGEVLRETGNPTYDPDELSTLSDALKQASHLHQEGLGLQNKSYANVDMDWESVSLSHARLYTSLLTPTCNTDSRY